MKLAITMVLTSILLIALTVVALGNPYTLQAENGLIQPPTGLGFEMTSNLVTANGSGTLGPSVKADISYGAFSSVTITGEFVKNFNSDNIGQKLVKVYYSPVRGDRGYTFYLNYDLDKMEMPVYGVSLWLNTNHFLTYVNLQALTHPDSGVMPITVTPGANLNFGSVALGAEMVIQPNNLSFQDLRAGVSYQFMKNIFAKLAYDTGMNHLQDQSYQLGLAMEI